MTTRRTLMAAAAATAALPARAHGDKKPSSGAKREQKDWGIAGDAKAARRSVVIRMTDQMRFTPDLIDVRLNETVRFDIRNDGRMLHEMVIGTAKELADHAALMQKFPGMEHDEPYMAHVAAGQRGRIVWTFNRAGEFEFACLIAGHYQAGMKGRLVVKG
jgi:uncharacterized cupredoxin-like copper-binding protein